jgi:hypothetical protein
MVEAVEIFSDKDTLIKTKKVDKAIDNEANKNN